MKMLKKKISRKSRIPEKNPEISHGCTTIIHEHDEKNEQVPSVSPQKSKQTTKGVSIKQYKTFHKAL